MDKYITALEEDAHRIIADTEKMDFSVLEKSGIIVSRLEEAFEGLKSFIAGYQFKDEEEEIRFFKETKPGLFSLLAYHYNVYNTEMRMPEGSIEDKKMFLKRVQDRIKYYFDLNLDFYRYYRSGSTHLDRLYFLRGKPDIRLLLDSFYLERDTGFSTCYDLKVTKILANERLSAYVDSRCLQLEGDAGGTPPYPKVRISWTGKKIELIEQVYGWIESHSFNNGNITIKELVGYVENVFNIDLGEYYDFFREMRKRTGSRTIFLDRLIKLLNDRMDNMDKK